MNTVSNNNFYFMPFANYVGSDMTMTPPAISRGLGHGENVFGGTQVCD